MKSLPPSATWLPRLAQPFPQLAPAWYALPLRLILGFGFMAHGYAKLTHGPAAFAHILQSLHLPLPTFAAWATIAVELLGGLALLLGFFVPLASVPLAVVVLVAMFTTQLPNGFTTIKLQAVTAAGAQFGPPGYELNLLYLAGLLALAIGGSGPWALNGNILRPTTQASA